MAKNQKGGNKMKKYIENGGKWKVLERYHTVENKKYYETIEYVTNKLRYAVTILSGVISLSLALLLIPYTMWFAPIDKESGGLSDVAVAVIFAIIVASFIFGVAWFLLRDFKYGVHKFTREITEDEMPK